MHSPRAQADKKAYQFRVKQMVELQPNLTLRQETVEDLLTEDSTTNWANRAKRSSRQVRGDAIYRARAVVLTTGTFPASDHAHGRNEDRRRPRGRRNDRRISGALHRLGFELARFKTARRVVKRPHDRLHTVRSPTRR